MHDESRSGAVARTLAGGAFLGLVAAGVVAAWAWASDRPECSGEMFGCLGEVLLVALVATPAALTVAWLGLRALGTSNPALAVAATLLLALVIPPLMDPPAWVWPVGLGALGCVVIALLDARPRRTSTR